jgi:hypothetical protein
MNESLSGEKVTGGVLSRDDFEFLISWHLVRDHSLNSLYTGSV